VSCQNLQCDYYVRNNVCNETNWEAVVENLLEEAEQLAIGTFVYRHCKFAPICIARCLARMYYVLHFFFFLSFCAYVFSIMDL